MLITTIQSGKQFLPLVFSKSKVDSAIIESPEPLYGYQDLDEAERDFDIGLPTSTPLVALGTTGLFVGILLILSALNDQVPNDNKLHRPPLIEKVLKHPEMRAR